MLLTKEVEVNLNHSNFSHFEVLGYKIPRIINKNGKSIVSSKSTIIVKVSDLQPTSRAIVQVQCDYDGKIFPKDYCSFKHQRRNIEKDCCNNVDCMKKKRAESNLKIHGVENCLDINGVRDKIKNTNIEKYGNEYAIGSKEIRVKIEQTFNDRYGVSNPFQIEEVNNKCRETCKEKYGVEWYTQTEEYKERHKETSMEKYGYENVSQVPEFIDKIKTTQFDKYGMFYTQTDKAKEQYKNTCQEKYGCDNTFQVQEFIDKSIATTFERYGVTHLMKLEKVRQERFIKMAETKYRNGTMQSSRQQEYIHKIVGGLLNYPLDRSCLDIAFVEDMIFCEYDGSGHSLAVSFGDITQEEFDKKELKRKYFLLSKGWKEIRIISLNDYLPSDDIIIDMLNYSKEYFESGHHWIKFDINNSKIITSQYIIDVDYGNLRKIKEKDLEDVN